MSRPRMTVCGAGLSAVMLCGGALALLSSVVGGAAVLRADDPVVAGSAGAAGVPGDAWADERNPVRLAFGAERLDLWSLRVPRAVSVPAAESGVHPIDAFLNVRLRAAGARVAAEADRRRLLRRLTLDLTGLLPTSAELAEFLGDDQPGAWERQVERLLSSPAYGERQARLWLDVVRYADTNGYERDEFRPTMWKYRDYVIRSFNADKPFDRFVLEQLAGDELVAGVPQSEGERDALLATGYLRLGQWDSTAAIFQEEARLQAELQADLTNTTAAAFLGLTMSCCQCHDHKYDPLTQADHYRMRAFFASLERTDELEVSLPSERMEIDRANVAVQAELSQVEQRLKSEGLAESEREALKARAEELHGQQRKPEHAVGVRDLRDGIPATFVLSQGDAGSPAEEVRPGFPALYWPEDAVIEPSLAGGSGRRLALARWIVSPANPWTARVLVNRLWQQHFGAGLVVTANDFGHTGARPEHQDLLDWLAQEFVRGGWSVKSMHRLLVTSAAYRRSVDVPDLAGAGAVDAENVLWGRQTLRRMDAETLRDCLLQVTGQLRPASGGAPRWPAISEELRHAQPAILEAEEGKDDGRMQGWYADAGVEVRVRSLYLVRKRCLPIPFLQVFDLPDATTSCARRDETIVAPQAIMLLNSPETISCVEALADELLSGSAESGDWQEAVIGGAFERLYFREPESEEREAARILLREVLRSGSESGRRHAVAELCRALVNSNEFVFVD